MKKTGELLRKAREGKNLSLHEIGLSLKISTKVLRAIEEGDESQLPAKTFLRGFVQSYANFLGLSSEQVLDVFYEEMGSTKPRPYIRTDNEAPAPTNITNQEPSNRNDVETVNPEKLGQSKEVRSLNERNSKTTIIVFVVGAVLVGLILFTKRMIDKYSKEAEVPTEEVAQTIEGATPLTLDANSEANSNTANMSVEAGNSSSAPGENETPLAPVSTPLAPAQTPSEAPAVSPTTSPRSPTPLASPSPSVTPAPTPVATPTETSQPPGAPIAPRATPTPSPTPVASATPPPLNPTESRPVELIVEALDAVEIEYSAPNGKLQKIRLSPEQVHTFKSRSGLSIQFSNGGAVNLILNGKDLGIPGDLGKSIKLSY